MYGRRSLHGEKTVSTIARLASLVVACVTAAATAGPPEFREVVKALEAAGLSYAVVGPEEDVAILEFSTSRHRDIEGEPKVTVLVGVFPFGNSTWLVARAFNLFSLFDCKHPDAARRVLMGANEKMQIWASFDYNESNGTVTGRVGMPILGERLDPAAIKQLLTQIPEGLDRLDPVLRRAMESGMVDWPEDDLGPDEPTGWLDATDAEGRPVRVGWAVWAERTAWASTLIAADALLRDFSAWDDEQRDSFGRILASEFGDSMARSVFADWLRGAQYIEQHYPPVAVRFFAPEGTEVTVTARCPEFAFGAATDTRTVDAMRHIDAEPMLKWDDRALRGIDVPTAATFRLELSCGGARATTDATIELQPVGSTELGLPATIPIAVYVNESHPWVRDIVAEAGKLRVAESLGCTDDTDYASAVKQIHAVWRALRARDLKYVSVHAADAGAEGSQAIREFHQSIRDEGANCADGTAAIASVLRALGFDVHLIEVPGHVLVGVYLKNPGTGRPWIFLETTALGDDAALPGQDYLDLIEETLPQRYLDGDWNCFEAACSAGEDRVSEAQREDNLMVASLATLREHGLRCIPVSRGEIGGIPAPPDQAALAARRAAAQEAVNAEHRWAIAWLESLPNAEPVPYAEPEALASDIERLGMDPFAMGRLLRCIDGDGAAPRCLRAMAAMRDAMVPVTEAAAAAFGGPSPNAGALLGLQASGCRVVLEPAQAFRTKVRVLDGDGDTAILLMMRSEADAHFIDGRFLELAHGSLCASAVAMAHALTGDALHDADGLRQIATAIADRVRAGKFKDHGEVLDEMQRLVLERFGSDRDPAAGENPKP